LCHFLTNVEFSEDETEDEESSEEDKEEEGDDEDDMSDEYDTEDSSSIKRVKRDEKKVQTRQFSLHVRMYFALQFFLYNLLKIH